MFICGSANLKENVTFEEIYHLRFVVMESGAFTLIQGNLTRHLEGGHVPSVGFPEPCSIASHTLIHSQCYRKRV